MGAVSLNNKPHCYIPKNFACEDELSRREMRGVILQAKGLGARKVIILGGEPMIYPHVMEMIKFIRGSGLAAKMFTNGTNINADTAEWLYDQKVQVVLKVNTFDERIQDLLAGKEGAFRIIQSALKNLKKAGYPAKGMPLGVSTVICRQNVNEVAEMWKWLRRENITPYFETITPVRGAKTDDLTHIAPLEADELFHKISEIDRALYGHIWEPQPPLVGAKCLRHLFSCLITSSGYVMPCVGVQIAAGNIRHDKLANILATSEVINDLQNYKEKIKGPCRKCDKLKECYGCRGAAYNLTGDYLASDPLCWKNAGCRKGIISYRER